MPIKTDGYGGARVAHQWPAKVLRRGGVATGLLIAAVLFWQH
ncbi:putative membrane protein YfcA [Acidovorax delafieldii]|nr:hypothetical protein [Acidovorax delafieldii]MDR6155228.1 putative membrane protein YfcA [Acidovorax delafieldii]